MRIIGCVIAAVITIALIYFLDSQQTLHGSKTPRFGLFLSPQKGFWQNAEPANETFNEEISFPQLQGKTVVYFDERLVPHVYADNENDAWFAQGYLHAKFRLWQMEFQMYAAGGRLSEIMGDSASGTSFLKVDKFFRRLGMVYAAEKALHAIESNPQMKAACDAYTAGVNAYIGTLREKDYPLEYKLLNYKPEPWTNLKSALLSKYMAYDLAGYEEDFERTNVKSILTKAQYEALFPYIQDSMQPVITTPLPKLNALKFSAPPATADSLYFNFKTAAAPESPAIKPDKDNGSNNWAVAGSKTKSGRPILCNDPHLGLNLPSLWYEMQISTPAFNAYGVSLAGAPNMLIGFNENAAWGLTNAERDVKDYYEVKFRDSTMQEYWFNGNWRKAEIRNEVIKIRNKPDDTERIAITVWGPVMYDPHYPDKLHTGKYYVLHWQAHEESDDLACILKLVRAKNYNDYLDAVSTFSCPGQNFVFADKSGDIAIRQAGKFPALWYRQGDFIMPGADSSYAWQRYIPDSLEMAVHNPERGFVSSANQSAYDVRTYPFYMPGFYSLYRSWLINRYLSSMQNITTDDMEKLQNNEYNLLAEKALPLLLKQVDYARLNDKEKRYLSIVASWNLMSDAVSEGATVFGLWMDSCIGKIYDDELHQVSLPVPPVEPPTLVKSMLKDSVALFADNINTPQKETLKDDVTEAFKSIIPALEKAKRDNALAWGKFKDGGINHLLKIAAFSRLHINAGGGENIINALKKNHGPSWRMVVELTDDINAYGVYPGGQSGNPGSRYYDNFIDTWVAGKYYHIKLYSKNDIAGKKDNLGRMVFEK
ncbi:penicillin acylase family protein [Parafilimonas sp.]|uniref:penicillin acylase family protein n=1 Tax=Parafilimonas sp. TaxID=1969739 RepID=UPI0039E24741